MGAATMNKRPKFFVVPGGKKQSDPIADVEYTEALSDADYDALTRLVKLDTTLKHSVETLRVANARVAIRSVAASRGINGAVAFLKDELRNMEALAEAVK